MDSVQKRRGFPRVIHAQVFHVLQKLEERFRSADFHRRRNRPDLFIGKKRNHFPKGVFIRMGVRIYRRHELSFRKGNAPVQRRSFPPVFLRNDFYFNPRSFFQLFRFSPGFFQSIVIAPVVHDDNLHLAGRIVQTRDFLQATFYSVALVEGGNDYRNEREGFRHGFPGFYLIAVFQKRNQEH